MQSFVSIHLRIFCDDRKGHLSFRGWNKKLDLKLISKQSNKAERTNVFEEFEQSDESDSDLEVIEDDYNPEIDECSDLQEDRSGGQQCENLGRFRKII